MFAIMAGMNIGLTRSTPRLTIVSVSVDVSLTPPPPVAMTAPTSHLFESSIWRPLSASAC